MKIICVDNFDRETVNDVLVAENVNEYYGKKIVKLMQTHLASDNGFDWFKLVADDYKLYEFDPNA